jgi:hypothetical protein
MQDGKYALWLIGACALLIDNRLTLQQRQDVLDSVLYAQLKANKLVPARSLDHQGWFGEHVNSLEKMGWIRLSRQHGQEPFESGPLLPMQRWLLAYDATLANEFQALRSALQKVDARRHMAKFVEPQLGMVNELGVVSGANVLALCSVAIDKQPPSQPGKLQLRAWVGSVNEEVFEEQRAALRALIETKPTETYITYVGKLQVGGGDGQA